jgi:hypothetical protein
MSFNRWIYVNGNPINLTDPTGLSPYATFGEGFAEIDKVFIDAALEKIAKAYVRGYKDIFVPYVVSCPGSDLESIRFTIDNLIRPAEIGPAELFSKIHGGPIKFTKLTTDVSWWAQAASKKEIQVFKGGFLSNFDTYKSLGGTMLGRDYVKYVEGGTSALPAGYEPANMMMVVEKYQRFVTHETGHAFDLAHFYGPAEEKKRVIRDKISAGQKDGTLPLPETPYNLGGFCGTKSEGWQWRLASQSHYTGEIFADMFVGWVHNCNYSADPRRTEFMNTYMPIWIYEIITD